MFTFITGGFRSGRSSYALRRASELGRPPWCYASRGVEADESLSKRLAQHRRDQEAIWHTRSVPDDITELTVPAAMAPYGALVIDGFARWVEQRVVGQPEAQDGKLIEQVEELADKLYRATTPVVLVTREVGLASPPEAPELRRAFRITASANQILANSASQISMMVSGVPLRVR